METRRERKYRSMQYLQELADGAPLDQVTKSVRETTVSLCTKHNKNKTQLSKKMLNDMTKQAILESPANLPSDCCRCQICEVGYPFVNCEDTRVFWMFRDKTVTKRSKSSLKSSNNLYREIERIQINHSKQIYFDIYKLNVFRQIWLNHRCNIIDQTRIRVPTLSVNLKYPRKAIMMISKQIESFQDVIANVDEYQIGNTLLLPPFQIGAKNNVLTPKIEYTITEEYRMAGKAYKYLQTPTDIVRIGLFKVCKLSGRLPFRDLYCFPFLKNLPHIDPSTDNFIGLITFELIPNKHNILGLKPLTNSQDNVEQKVIDIFGQPKLSAKEIDELFNPSISQPTNSNGLSQIVEIDSTSSDDSDESDDDDSNDSIDLISEPIIGDEIIIEEQLIQPVDNYIIKYNKHYKFTDDEKDLIKDTLNNLLLDKPKAKELFGNYNVVQVIKPISKDYTSERYINVILYNNKQDLISPQYHLYLNQDNNVVKLTSIENHL